ncbi:ferredoxin reductase [Rhodococcus sp. X156]|uniref:ferredoxin reductase n=1 Tax=Rhodococcus sp. X156 TaxID=2499145 RepID=UPI001F49B70C|nr:ferredoxin reductase [Rhodococcus sp. X156]
MQETKDPAAALHPDVDLLRGAASRLTTPLLPDDYLHLLNPLWSARELRGKVVKVVKETDTAATLVIKPGWGWSFDYKPGQYVGIATQLEGHWYWRSYSLTSSPRRDQGHISITVKATPEGFVSNHLVNGVEPGSIVRLASPKGDFTLPDPPPAKALFLTAGSGITPVMGMLRTLKRRGGMTDILLIHSAPDAADMLFREELKQLEADFPTFRLHEQLTREKGKLQLKDLGEVCPDWTERQTWACGPAPMLDSAEEHWKQHNLSEQLHMERFTVALSGGGGEGGTVTYQVSDKTIEVDGATTLLDAGEKAGIQMPFGCRMGICQSCVVPLLEGSVRDLRSGQDHHEGDRIQTCVSAAAGDCVLEA